ncbi:macro domain-containing protein [Desulfothermus naphthae]
MIQFKKGNILNEKVEALVNTVNCVGVMGKGIALQFKKKFPQNYLAYKKACQEKQVKIGKMFVYKLQLFSNPKYIINFPTKRHWKEKSKLEYIRAGLKDLVTIINKLKIKSIAIPPLGCGLGGLDWNLVKGLLEEELKPIKDKLEIIIFTPQLTDVTISVTSSINSKPKMTAGRAALIKLINIYLEGLLDPYITLLEIHKLMYFLQEAGYNLKLKFQKGYYGPYAENLRHVLNKIEGHFIKGYSGDENPYNTIELTPMALEMAEKILVKNVDLQKKLSKVVNLVEGFESPFGLELLATTHWVIVHENVNPTVESVSKAFSQWNYRKKKFTDRQIKLAIDTLRRSNFIFSKELKQ